MHNSRDKSRHLTYTLILTHRPQVTGLAGPGRPSTQNPPDRFLGRHFIERIRPTGKSKIRKMVCILFITEEEEGVDLLVS
jgi:hypothetical protein